jgi:hypothetical protein
VVRLALRLVLAIATVALALTSATAAKADLLPGLLGGNCGSTSAVFAPWGDPFKYYFAPNGGFESGSTGWSLSGGATVVAGNESFKIHSSNDSRSLLIPDRGSASINVCYGVTYPGFRFFVKSADGKPANVRVRVVARSLLGILSILDGGTVAVGSEWAPSSKISCLFSALVAPLGTKSMQIQIVAGGNVQIDDLYVDPFLQRD